MNRHIPLDEPIDLLNVAFENPRKIKLQKEGNIGGLPRQKKREKMFSKKKDTNHEGELMYSVPDRTTGLLELEELRRICPGRIWNFVRHPLFVIGIDFYSLQQVEINVSYQVFYDQNQSFSPTPISTCE